MDSIIENVSAEQSRNEHDLGQDSNHSNNNSSKGVKAQLYIRGSGPLRKSVERQSDTTMTSNNDTARSVNDNPDDNSSDQKKPRKPDTPLYTVKGAADRDGYQDREYNRRGGREIYSNNSQRRNQFTNNNRNRHKREFDQGKKPNTDDNSNSIISNTQDTSNQPPPPTNHRSAAILSQSTKSYERNVNIPPPGSEDAAPVTAQNEQPGRDQNRNNNNYKNNNKSNQYQNRRNYNDYYDRGRHNKRGRDDRHYYEDYGGRQGYQRGNYQSDSRYSSTQDVSQDNKYSSSDSLHRSAGQTRAYRGAHSDMGRHNRSRHGTDNRYNHRYKEGEEGRGGAGYGGKHQQERYNQARRDSESQQYNNRHRNSQSNSEPVQSSESSVPAVDNSQGGEQYSASDVNELSEQLASTSLDQSDQRNQQNQQQEDSKEDQDAEDPAGYSWSKIDWTADVEEDVWATTSTTNESPQEDQSRFTSSPPSSSSKLSPPPPPSHEEEKDWGSVRRGGKPALGTEDSGSNSSWSSRHNHNWSRNRGGRDDSQWGQQGGYRQNYADRGSGYQQYNDKYGEPKRKPYNTNTGSSAPRGGRNQFRDPYFDLPPRFRKKIDQEFQETNQQQQQQQRPNPQPPSSYPSRQPPPQSATGDSAYHSLGTYSDSQWSGESLEVRGHHKQNDGQFNSLPPPGRRQYEGAPRGDYSRGRRYSTYETDSSDYNVRSSETDQPQSLPPPSAPETTETVKFSWSEQVEHEQKLEKLQSALQVTDTGSRGRERGRGGFSQRRGRDIGSGGGVGSRRDIGSGGGVGSRSSSRSRRRRRKRSYLHNYTTSGSSQGSRRRSVSRDTVDTNMSGTTSRSRLNSDRSAASETNNWRDRPQKYEHSRSSEVSNWRDRPNPNPPSTSSTRSHKSADKDILSWRQPPPQISEEPLSRGGGSQGPTSPPIIGGLIKLPENPSYPSSPADYHPHSTPAQHSAYPSQDYCDYNSYPSSRRTPQLYNPHNPSHPIPVPPARAPLSHSPSPRLEYLTLNGQPLLPPAEGNSALPPAWYAREMLTKPSYGKHLVVAAQANNEISALLHTPGWLSHYERLSRLRASVKDVLVWFVTHDIKFCQAENVESNLWKLGFYNVIEAVRNYQPQDVYVKKLLNDIIDDAIVFFESLLGTLQERYRFCLDAYLNADGCSLSSSLGYALQSALKICIFLGDLCRYKETFKGSNNFSLAAAWYTKANLINPRNGRPFNQLGLIAYQERRQLDAIYNYSRSLLTPNYLRSVHERLILVFDENRKKYDSAYSSVNAANNMLLDQKKKETREYRREIWIHPEDNRSTRRNQLINDSDTEVEAEAFEKLSRLSHVELSKQFTCSFLMVHGKLFSKTGLDTLVLISKQMLREFKLLLAQNGLTNTRLLQLLSINMFAIERTSLKENKIGSENYKSLTQELALIISLEMFYWLIHQVNCLLVENKPTRDAPISNKHLLNLLPSIKIWCDWFVCQTRVWNPPPSCSDYHIGPGDVWTELAACVNALLSIRYDYNAILVPPDRDELEAVGRVPSKSDDSNIVQVRLPEDAMFFGYNPLALISNIQDPMYTLASNDAELVHTCVRLKRILFFGTEFLVGIDPPVLKLHKTEAGQDQYISVVEVVSKEESDEERGSFEFEEELEAPKPEEKAPVPDGNQMCSEYQELMAKREILNKQEEQCEMKKRILESHKKIRVQLEIKPHYLVPDTNCFIDYLDDLKTLANKKTGSQSSAVLKRNLFTILIPCIVYNELTNISKSAKKSETVVANAQKALQYIQSETTSVKYVTTKGTFLAKNTFSMEEDDLLLKNDDKILETCLSLAKKKPLKKAPVDKSSSAVNASCESDGQDGLEIIFRDVVLLTEDRNLRLKALARDIPVTNVNNFNKWYNVRVSR